MRIGYKELIYPSQEWIMEHEWWIARDQLARKYPKVVKKSGYEKYYIQDKV